MDYKDQIQTIKDNVPKVYEAGYAAGANGATIPVDQAYDPNSTNAQSGVAVAEAVEGIKTNNGTVVSQNADFAEVAEWWDGNPDKEDRTGYFVCANVPVDGIVMKKATSLDDVKGVTILAPAFAGNYSKDKLDENGNLLPKYSFVAIIGFVPVIDNGTCTIGGRCMPDDNGCAVPSSNSMGYQVVNRIDENRVLIIIEPNGDMVQRVKTKMNKLQEDVDNLAPEQAYDPESENAQSGKAVAEALTPILEQIENIGTGGVSEHWEHIETVTLAENTNQIQITNEPNGTVYNFKKMKVIINNATGGSNNAYVNMGAYAYYRLQDKIALVELFIEQGYLWARAYSGLNEYSQMFNHSKPHKKDAINMLRITGNGTLLAGTTFEIWGVRA